MPHYSHADVCEPSPVTLLKILKLPLVKQEVTVKAEPGTEHTLAPVHPDIIQVKCD